MCVYLNRHIFFRNRVVARQHDHRDGVKVRDHLCSAPAILSGKKNRKLLGGHLLQTTTIKFRWYCCIWQCLLAEHCITNANLHELNSDPSLLLWLSHESVNKHLFTVSFLKQYTKFFLKHDGNQTSLPIITSHTVV